MSLVVQVDEGSECSNKPSEFPLDPQPGPDDTGILLLIYDLVKILLTCMGQVCIKMICSVKPWADIQEVTKVCIISED